MFPFSWFCVKGLNYGMEQLFLKFKDYHLPPPYFSFFLHGLSTNLTISIHNSASMVLFCVMMTNEMENAARMWVFFYLVTRVMKKWKAVHS